MQRALILLFSSLMLLGACGVGDDDGGGSFPAVVDAAPGEKLPFMSACTTNDECATGLCFPFNNKGPHCTHECMSADECEAPSPGCNGMGVCKTPQ